VKTTIRTAPLLLLLVGLLAGGCGPMPAAAPAATPTALSPAPAEPVPVSKFVSVHGGKFVLEGRPLYYVGTNFWQGMNLGVDGPGGDRAQLVRELDRLKALGVTNLRVMASSEGPNTEPYRMVPALMTSPGVYNETVLDGLDFLLSEMGKRGMQAVMVLNNFWYWSGGMAQYVSWRDGTDIPYPGDYTAYMAYASRFYYCGECQTWYRNHIAMLAGRRNPYTGMLYRDDPAIFSWELANEPRRYPNEWIYGTAAYIKSLDPNHMVTTGSEGTPPGERQDFIATHSSPDIDYLTIHIWPQNWGWYRPETPESYAAAVGNAHLYFANREKDAVALGKPLVLEEFGLARDWDPLQNIYNPGAPTLYRNRFYQAMFDQVFASAAGGGPAAGDNFWVWAGEARPDAGWVGDPPHETPGWYSVYDTDLSTLAIITEHALEMAGVGK
jgi:mannan endo-1,4-beta-mannosidase